MTAKKDHQKIKCCSELHCKATAEVKQSVAQEMQHKDKPLKEILDAPEQASNQ